MSIDYPAILRWQIPIVTNPHIINMPSSHKILSCAPARSGYAIDVWAKTSPSEFNTDVTFHIFGTGHPLPDLRGTLEFIGTNVMSDGLIWHLFEEVLF